MNGRKNRLVWLVVVVCIVVVKSATTDADTEFTTKPRDGDTQVFSEHASSQSSGCACPLSGCSEGFCRLTQSCDTTTNGGNQWAEGIPGVGTLGNYWARCFDLTAEGVPGALTINSVTFGVQQATADGINVDVNLYIDTNGCPANGFGSSAVLVDSVALVVGPADEDTQITVNFPDGPVIPAGSHLIVEVGNPDNGFDFGFEFRTMSNDGGQCASSFLRAPDSGIPDWFAVDIVFPDSHFILVAEGTLQPCETPADCNDGNACTDEDCIDGECEFTPNDALCDDGNACTIDDMCDPQNPDVGCVGTSICDFGFCDDGIDCTDDFCDPASGEVHIPNDSLCDDGLFCNGAETCGFGCQPGTDPCSAPDFPICNEDTDTCEAVVPCETDADCNDGNACTDDECDPRNPDAGEDGCVNTEHIHDDGIDCTDDFCDPVNGDVHIPNDSLCDDGLFCNGAETCGFGCQPGTDPCSDPDFPICNEDTDTCEAVVPCENDGDCIDHNACTHDICDPDDPDAGSDGCVHEEIIKSDGIECTDDDCVDGRGVFIPNDANCDDGLFCNGAETCDPTEDCQPGSNPCSDPDFPICNEDTDTCEAVTPCEADHDCDDHNECTHDICDPDDPDAGQDGCVNRSVCDPGGGCDDGIECTDDLCDPVGGSSNTPNDANCDDGLLCTIDSCIPQDPDADGDGCVHTDIADFCPDGIECTDDLCDRASGCLSVPNDANCDDGLFCNGAETCDPTEDCQAGSNPCMDPDFPICNEDAGACEAAVIALHLDIKPGSCPNGVKRGSNATVWVALLGSADFDITQVDSSTWMLARADGEGQSIAPQNHPRLKDVATPFDGELCGCHAAGKDGILDLRAKFKAADMAAAFGLDDLPTGTTVELKLTGTLLDSTPFAANDCIRIMR